LLTTLEEKQRFLPNYFQGTVLILEFNAELKDMSARQFVEDILISRLGMARLVVGYDHAFGKDRSGTIVELSRLGQELGFDVEVVGPVMIDGRRISSSLIRRALRDGAFADALSYLGHPYALVGTVEKGIGLGHKIGYPTANLRYNASKLLPPAGVYACRAQVGEEKINGMMFVGQNHFNPEDRITVEVNLFAFSRDLYGREISVCPTHFLRANRRFDSTAALAAQIELDKKEVLRIQQQEIRNVS
jgi:riboflavin kinase/FMN adenylyltransferase